MPGARAEPAFTVTTLSGTLLAKKSSGAIRALSVKSQAEPGFTLITRKETYAELTFADDTQVTLGPDTQLIIQKYSFDSVKSQHNGGLLTLIRGGVLIAGGRLGKRSEETFALDTPLGTIEIRGNTFFVEYVPEVGVALRSNTLLLLASNESSVRTDAGAPFAFAAEVQAPAMVQALQLAQFAPPASSKPPGLYVHVIDGIINLSNKGGSQNFSAGQFGYTANITKPPVIVPTNPGLKFTPPPTFSSTSNTTSGSTNKAAAVDCEVR
jgi:hypothetical protein